MFSNFCWALIDRIAAGKACKAWFEALGSPSIWRSVSLHLDRDVYLLNDELLDIAIWYGHRIARLELDWSKPQVQYILQRDVGVSFINILKHKNVQLEELILKDFGFCYRWTFRHKMNVVLNQFLGCQSNLRVFRIINTYVRPIDVQRLVSGVAQSCGHVLKQLDLRNAFRKVHTSHASPRLIEAISCMSVLTDLSIDYHVLSDEILIALASTNRCLTNFNIVVSELNSWHHPLTDSLWYHLNVSCPGLQVFLRIENVSHFEELVAILTPSIPLRSFHLHCGWHWNHTRSRNLRSTMCLLINQYSHTLVELSINIKSNREMLDDLILEVVAKCFKLEDLHFDGIVRNLDVISDLFHYFETTNIKKFKTFHLTPREISSRNRDVIRKIMTDYKDYFNSNDYDYFIDDQIVPVFYYK